MAMTFIRLQEQANLKDVETKINEVMKENGQREMEQAGISKKLTLQPMSDIHYDTTYEGDSAGKTSYLYIRVMIAIGALILILACMNYVNLSTAQAGRRALDAELVLGLADREAGTQGEREASRGGRSREPQLVAANVDPVARLRYFVRAFVRFSARYPEVNRLMMREGMDDDWRLDWLVDHIVRPWYERVRALYAEARRLGAAPDMAYPHFYYILTGGAALLFSMAPEARRLADIDPQDDTVVTAHADALANLLFPGDRL